MKSPFGFFFFHVWFTISTAAKKCRMLILPMALACACAQATEYHVAMTGSDAWAGTATKPFRTIGKAAQVAQPGDVISVGDGTYREWVNPPRGGTSDTNRITYRAEPGEKPIIKGSERYAKWTQVDGNVWKAELPAWLFRSYNPFADTLHGDWFAPDGKAHHAGSVFVNGEALREAQTLDAVKQGPAAHWCCAIKDGVTTLWINLLGQSPNEAVVEITTRQACFYPKEPGRNYITVRGFTMCQAATPWAPPTMEQIGLVGTHWSKGWIIENNVISDSRCAGITLGGDSANSAGIKPLDYVQVIQNAAKLGWSKETIGSHIVRNNTIFNCGQAGICGSLGAVFSQVIHNDIHNVHNYAAGDFGGAEIAAIKFHAAIDVLIRNNAIHDSNQGLWLDWMAQGTRVAGNLFYNNDLDAFFEVDHGPYLVENNLFMSNLPKPLLPEKYKVSTKNNAFMKDQGFISNVFRRGGSVGASSQGGAYVHNLFMSGIRMWPDGRETPYFGPHSTGPIKMADSLGKLDTRFINNIIWDANLKDLYDDLADPGIQSEGNVYGAGAQAYRCETNPVILPADSPKPKLVMESGNVYLTISYNDAMLEQKTALATTQSLGKTVIADEGFESPFGEPITVDKDYAGKLRSDMTPTAGPFENPGKGMVKIKVWSPIWAE